MALSTQFDIPPIMETIKTIKIFLASSEELQAEREKMADLIVHLNKLFRCRGIELDLEKWEYLDASQSTRRKQNEYNDILRQCDICVVIFWRRIGDKTVEELDVAHKSMLDGRNPRKIYVFFKNPNSDDVSQETRDFLADYERCYGGHYLCKYQTVDSLKLEFLLQLELYLKDLIGEKTIEVRGGQVYVDHEAVVNLNSVPFAAANESFKKMQNELEKLQDEIEGLRIKEKNKKERMESRKAELEAAPDDEDCLKDYDDAKNDYDEVDRQLQECLNRKNKLEEDFEREQQYLFDTARRMSALRNQHITDRMSRALEAFEKGDAHLANDILKNVPRDANNALADIHHAKEAGKRSVDELLLKTSTIMSDATITIEERIEQAYQLYQKAVTLAKEVDYEKEKYDSLLEQYATFLEDHAKYDEALAVLKELAQNREKLLGEKHPETASVYSDIGAVYGVKCDFENALKYTLMALDILVEELGIEHPYTAGCYMIIGEIYRLMSDFDKALEYHIKALKIFKKVSGEELFSIADCYHKIGNVYGEMGDYDKALKYNSKALEIFEKVFGKENSITASNYHDIGVVYAKMDELKTAMEYFLKALSIRDKVLGKEHPDTAITYRNIGIIYAKMDDFDMALEYFLKALSIHEKLLGKRHSTTARTYYSTAWALHSMGRDDEALPLAENAVKFFPKNPLYLDTLANVYLGLGRDEEALPLFELSLKLGK